MAAGKWRHRRDSRLRADKPDMLRASTGRCRAGRTYWTAIDVGVGRPMPKSWPGKCDFIFVAGEPIIRRWQSVEVTQWAASSAVHGRRPPKSLDRTDLMVCAWRIQGLGARAAICAAAARGGSKTRRSGCEDRCGQRRRRQLRAEAVAAGGDQCPRTRCLSPVRSEPSSTTRRCRRSGRAPWRPRPNNQLANAPWRGAARPQHRRVRNVVNAAQMCDLRP